MFAKHRAREQGSRRAGGEVGRGVLPMVAVMRGRGLLLEGNHLCGATAEEGGDVEPLV